MKILIVGDLHLKTKSPRRRREADFAEVGLGKLRQILKMPHDVVVQVGDFFDSPDPSKGLIAGVIELLDDRDPWLAIHGQHDLRYHSQEAAGRSALRVLEAAGRVKLLDFGESMLFDGLHQDVTFYGAGFGQRPGSLRKTGDDQFNVLISHAMVGDKPLWPGHDLTGPEQYVCKHPGYNLYVLGDFHYPFSTKVGNSWVINAGAVLRLTADTRDRTRKPKVVLFDTETNEPQDIYLDVTPEAEAFDFDEYEEDKAGEQTKASFVGMAETLRKSGTIGTNFKNNVDAALDVADADENVRNKVWLCWRRIMDKKE